MTRFIPSLLAVGLLAAATGCSDQGGDGDGDADLDTDDDFDLERPELPALTPCPEGWTEVPPSDPSDPYDVATCDPWPEEGPARLTPCPAGWVEVPRSGPGDVATCDPWPEEGPAKLTPCPDGWREIPRADPGGVGTCDPWPEGGAQECGIDEAHFPGEPGCERIGTECPGEGEWAEGLPGTGVLYVRSGAPTGGTGTRASPFRTIGEALALATPGTVVALSEGTFDEEVVLPEGVTLWGACVDGTLVARSTWSDEEPTIAARSPSVVVTNLRVGGERGGIRVEGEEATLELRDVAVVGARAFAVAARDRASLTVERLVVRDTRCDPGEELVGIGLNVHGRASATVESAVFERCMYYAIGANEPGTRIELSDVAVLETRSGQSVPTGGLGILVGDGAQVDAVRAVLEQNRAVGVMVERADTVVRLSDVVVRDVLRDETLGSAVGLGIESGARGELVRLLVERVPGEAVGAGGLGTVVVATDMVVRDVGGSGLFVADGAEATAERALIERYGGAGVVSQGAGASVVLSDLEIRDTVAEDVDLPEGHGHGVYAADGGRVDLSRLLVSRAGRAGLYARTTGTEVNAIDLVMRDVEGGGLVLEAASRVELSRVLVERSSDVGVAAIEAGTRAALSDVVVRDSVGPDPGSPGDGVHVVTGAELDLTRALVERNHRLGVFASAAGTIVRLTDVLVRDTLPLETYEVIPLGRGLQVQDARVEAVRCLFDGNHEIGVNAFGPSAELVLSDIVVRDTLAAGQDGTYGNGVSVALGARADLSRALVVGNRDVGLYVQQAGTSLVLSDIVVRDTLSQESDGRFGRGLAVQEGAAATVTRAIFSRNRDIGVAALGSGTEVSLSDAVVVDTLGAECGAGSCAGAAGGRGVGVYEEANVEMTRFLVARSAMCGLQISHGVADRNPLAGSMDLHEGEVSDNPIGANVHAEGFDLERLMDRVIYRDNERTLDTDELPIPDAIVPPELESE